MVRIIASLSTREPLQEAYAFSLFRNTYLLAMKHCEWLPYGFQYVQNLLELMVTLWKIVC